jgi:hypothetical protein
MKAYEGSGNIALPFMTQALDGGELSASRSCRFTSEDRTPGNHLIGGWVVPDINNLLLFIIVCTNVLLGTRGSVVG